MKEKGNEGRERGRIGKGKMDREEKGRGKGKGKGSDRKEGGRKGEGISGMGR